MFKGLALIKPLLKALTLPCALCGDPAAPGELCPACLGEARLDLATACLQCALPLDANAANTKRCPACSSHPPAFSQTRALLRYEPPWDAVVLAFKSGRFHHAPWMAREMTTLLGTAMAAGSVFVPVPAGKRSRHRRGANPAAVLARACARASGGQQGIGWVWRRHEGSLQHQQDRSARESAMIEAFEASHRLAHRPVILVDDVMTTGSTLDAMARAVKAAGAREVEALVLARTP